MANGWAEFLKRIRTRAVAGQRNRAWTWTKFQSLAKTSLHAKPLKIIVGVGQSLPEKERYTLAVAIAQILAPMEWPSEWEAFRPGLVSALDFLVEETDTDLEGSAFELLATIPGAEVRSMAYLALYAARELLRKPCRRDQLRTVALLCNTGVAICIQTYRCTRNTPGGRLLRDPIVSYCSAADLLNEAVGVVLFEGLHAALEED